VLIAATLSLYIARNFTLSVVGMLTALTGLVGLFDFIELLRRSASRPEATFVVVAQMAALRLPWICMQILPFAVLLGGILAFWKLTRSSELIVARASGVSAWHFLAAPLVSAVMIGCFTTAVISPVSAVMRTRAEAMENIYLRTGGGPLALSGGQLWLRQSDAGLTPQGVAILHARGVTLRNGELSAQDVSIFRLDANDRLLERVEVNRAQLEQGAWQLDNARTILPGHLPSAPRPLALDTNMTVARVQESFAPPDTLSFWALPDFIALLDRSGFSSIRHRLQFQTLLALPLLAGTMTLLAAGFSMRPSRRGGVARMIGGGIAAGFALFLVSKIAEEFGQSGAMPAVLAAWAPAASGLMLSVALLLHLEDG
jgi:lipopolysaccharide export system permease protein